MSNDNKTDETDNDELIDAIFGEDTSDYILIELLGKCIDQDVLEWMQ